MNGGQSPSPTPCLSMLGYFSAQSLVLAPVLFLPSHLLRVGHRTMATNKKARGCCYSLNDNSLNWPVFLEIAVEMNTSLLTFADGNAGSQLSLAKKTE